MAINEQSFKKNMYEIKRPQLQEDQKIQNPKITSKVLYVHLLKSNELFLFFSQILNFALRKNISEDQR